jgi:hypothetical protein
MDRLIEIADDDHSAPLTCSKSEIFGSVFGWAKERQTLAYNCGIVFIGLKEFVEAGKHDLDVASNYRCHE